MATPKGFVCESCTDAVIEAAMTVGEDYHDTERVAMLARTSRRRHLRPRVRCG